MMQLQTQSGLVLLLVTLASAALHQEPPDFGSSKLAHSKDDAYYDFRYAVNDEESGVVSDRWESRSGRFVKGAYSLLDPDGKVRSVHYEVDGDHGFKAVVRTSTPRLSLLSIQSARQARLEHADPPVNKVLVEPPPSAPLLSEGTVPYNYHARRPRPRPPPSTPAPTPLPPLTLVAVPSSPVIRQRSPSPLVASSPLTSTSSSASAYKYKDAFFTEDLVGSPSRAEDDDNYDLESLQNLSPPPLNAFSRSYDSYPKPVRTNPNRRPNQPVQDIHRTVYSDYINKELQRITPLRSSSASRRGFSLVPTTVAQPTKRNDQFLRRSRDPAPFSRQWNRHRQHLTETSPLTSSYFL